MKEMYPLLASLKSEWEVVSDSSSKEPLYHQLYLLLKNTIINGSARYGEQMPTELQLSDAFAVSRITVKRAMDDLAAEKLIARRRGKGSHVTYQYVHEPVKAPLVGMLENLAEMGKHSKVVVLAIEKLVPPAAVREELNLGKDEKAVKVIRVRSNENGQPYAYYVSWTLPQAKGLTKKNIEKKTRLDILKENGIKIVKVEQTLAAENANSLVASQLQVNINTALLSLKRQSFDSSGELVDILYGLYNPKLFTYKMVLGAD
ncbi:GntR family transcriptional regulator [Glaciecola sp. 33A]|jgi:GntR family transcriptional regulator|uniref:GntR family transcriptional regulator n=1 Tax=Glaciecola sp. 33A TaxID=2057807 RepID=UPI000C31E3C7|nr:GntR family transcriptional regulator [Glaciecola sp. 33A]PKI01282.1 GntR family transcriptional regulator [Glaciecola sp. 33A]